MQTWKSQSLQIWSRPVSWNLLSSQVPKHYQGHELTFHLQNNCNSGIYTSSTAPPGHWLMKFYTYTVSVPICSAYERCLPP